MRDWYEQYYAAIQHSEAYSEFCRRVFGLNLGQHGFADMTQIRALLTALAVRPTDRILDLGCGNGGITAEIGRTTGANMIGLDYVEHAVSTAQLRYANTRTWFTAADIGALCFCSASIDVVISIDTLYFTSIRETVAALTDILTPGGRMGILYSHGASPEDPLPTFDRNTLSPGCTPLGEALETCSLEFTAQDLTEDDRLHALLKRSVLEELRPQFAAEGNEFLFDNRYGEANGVLDAIDAGAHARYLYLVSKSKDRPLCGK